MTAETYDLEESSPRLSPPSQIAITIFLGIPMTIALAIALAFYCTYECLKFALSAKSQNHQTSNRTLPASISDEQTFTTTLNKFAGIHGPSQSVEFPAHDPSAADKEPSQVSASTSDDTQTRR